MSLEKRLLHGVDRRRFLNATWATALGATALALVPGDDVFAEPSLGADPFTLGVASGDPKPDGAVLWTRLAPDPLNGGGLTQPYLPVRWRVATDSSLRNVVQSGIALAHASLAHSVHVEVQGLLPNRVYFYQFDYRAEQSRVGRFRTAPDASLPLASLDFALLTCQAWHDGYYTVLNDVADQDLDVVFHLGDYLYEYDPRKNVRGVTLSDRFAGETVTLERYRDQHALYKTDPHLQRLHARHPMVVIWDDHEVQNDYSGRFPEYMNMPLDVFLKRRSAAYQAYYEHMPLRRPPTSATNNLLIYRSLSFGDLAEFVMLDTRQHRSDNPCGDGESQRCAAALEPGATMLGVNQERWVNQRLANGKRRWTFLTQGPLMAELDHDVGAGTRYWNDAWDGYPAARDRLFKAIADGGVRNPVVFTGDWHSTFVNDLHRDFKRPGRTPLATEFVTPAITSGGDRTPYGPYYGPMIPANPHIRYYEGDKRGYFRMSLTHERLKADLRFASRVETPRGSVDTVASFVVADGQPGALTA
ncbi:alkaline phosphatase D [Methylopila capsulata]|uniref:Alkaline phosphatase n=1 Tax=Methylopila capsulata TaxID=61654 RepID=A0A9W6IQQ4_9HYPH|nr:alkaline phosphatase D family protein [Methylopila capsulata]MBM7851707.1 alkaline phosphatase D [Methylopila capsulata]GLK54767.1 alkaline phosphatase [Methylopila capsulata]